MEFTVNRSDLVRELSLSQGVVEKKTTIPILSNVLIEASGDRIQLTATDLELGIRCSCPAEVKTAGAGTLPARRLLDYARLLPEAPIHFKFTEKNWANLTCGRARTRIAGMSRETFPEIAARPDTLAEIPSRVLARLINRTAFAVSVEESRFALNGAQLVLAQDRVTMVATDGHRLALCEESGEFGAAAGHKALVPKKAMMELLKLLHEADPEAKVEFSADENNLFFGAGSRLLVARKLTGNFPDYERVLPAEHPNRVALNRDEFRAAVERVAQFADERSHAIRIGFAPGEVKLHASLSDTGSTEETLPAVYDGPEVQVGFNAQYIMEFLRAVGEDEEVIFLFRDSSSAGELRPADGSADGLSYRYIVMPMRI